MANPARDVPGLAGPVLTGCGGESDSQAPPQPPDERGLKQFAELYRNDTKQNKRGPKSLKELDVKGQGYPVAVELPKSGELFVQRGASLSPEGETAPAVLAYPKTVPEQGGLVLLQDGWTIKTMTAAEFKAAPKAGGRSVLCKTFQKTRYGRLKSTRTRAGAPGGRSRRSRDRFTKTPIAITGYVGLTRKLAEKSAKSPTKA